MGKTLSALRNDGLVLPPHAPPAVALAPVEAEEEPGGEVPFIEFGPKRKVVDASPGVLPVTGPTLAPVPPPPPAAPQTVSLRVLPEPKKSRLAPELIAFHA